MDSLKDKFQIRMDEDDDDIAAVVAAGRKAKASALTQDDDIGDSDLNSSMYAELKRKYDELVAENKEQDKTINF